MSGAAKETERLFAISPGVEGRLDRFLSLQYPRWSRTRLQRLINQRFVLVDGHPVSPSHKLRAGQSVAVRWPESPPRKIRSENIPLPFPVLYEDDDVLVVNKPVGLVVHPSAGHTDGNSLIELLASRILGTERSPGVAAGEAGWPDETRAGLVHRLDRDTSGVIVLAKTPESHVHLSKQFARRQVKKTYLALVKGKMPADSGTLECHIARHPGKRQRFAVAPSGRWASTKFQVKERLASRASLVELYPLTGRTHQLRVQLAGYGHPILGDRVYGEASAEFSFIKRQMLHARRLEFAHPETGKKIVVEAPPPTDFQETLKVIRSL